MNFTTDFFWILKPAACLRMDSTTNLYIVKTKANCFFIKGLHRQRLYSKAPTWLSMEQARYFEQVP